MRRSLYRIVLHWPWHTNTKRILLGLPSIFISALSWCLPSVLASSLYIPWLQHQTEDRMTAWDVMCLLLGVCWVWKFWTEDSTCTWYECMTMDGYRHACCTMILNHPQNYGTVWRPEFPSFLYFFKKTVLQPLKYIQHIRNKQREIWWPTLGPDGAK